MVFKKSVAPYLLKKISAAFQKNPFKQSNYPKT